MCFCESNLTKNDGMFTTCLRTLKIDNKKFNNIEGEEIKRGKCYIFRGFES